MAVTDAVELFRPAGFRWWLAGGRGLEAHLDQSWRAHADIDIGVCRSDASRLHEILDGWDIHVAAAGTLTAWNGGPLDPDASENNLWCRPTPTSPWMIDILLGDGDDNDWIFRRDPAIRRRWDDAVLATSDGTPYLAPELQLLFKSWNVRPKDDLDAATVIPLLEPVRRSWLADHLPAEHPWQRVVGGTRARLAIAADTDVESFAAGRSSQAWGGVQSGRAWVARIPIPNSGRRGSYRSEALITRHLSETGHPVCSWQLVPVDDVECSIGLRLEGTPIERAWTWPRSFVERVAALLRDLHQLPATGWGPLENRADRLHGISPSPTTGIVERWCHAPIWPFDESRLDAHPLATIAPDLLPALATLESQIVAAAIEPFGVLHSDLHRQHLLHTGDELTGVLDFGDAFIGSTAWDFGLLQWYYGLRNTQAVVDAYDPDSDLAARGALLGVAVGCYKIAKTPSDGTALRSQLRSLLDTLPAAR